MNKPLFAAFLIGIGAVGIVHPFLPAPYQEELATLRIFPSSSSPRLRIFGRERIAKKILGAQARPFLWRLNVV
jgi:hypothetical protein